MRNPIQHLLVVVCLSSALAATFIVQPQQKKTTDVTPQIDPAAQNTKVPPARLTDLRPQTTHADNLRPQGAADGSEEYSSSRRIETPANGARGIEVFANFDRWMEDYVAGTVDAGVGVMAAKGQSLALARRSAMVKLMESNPEEALHRAIASKMRKQLPSSITQHLEERVAGMGKLEVLANIASPGSAEGKPSVERFATINGRSYKAFVYGRRVKQISTEAVPLHGIAIGDVVALHESPVRVLEQDEGPDPSLPPASGDGLCPVSKAAGIPSAAVQVGNEVFHLCHAGHIETFTQALEAQEDEKGPRFRISAANSKMKIAKQGPITVLFMRIIFPDDTTESISEAAAQDTMRQVNDFFVANSYGLVSFSATVTPLLILPQAKSWYRTNDKDLYTLLADARTVAQEAGFDTANFDLDCVNHPICSPKAYVGHKGAWLYDKNFITACHEFGHNLGLYHAHGWLPADGSIIGAGIYYDYGNPFDVMGSGQDATAHFNVYNKNWLNWLPDESVQTVTSDGIYRLYPFDVSRLENGLAYALKIRKDNQRDYWIETRQSSRDYLGSLLVNWSPGGGTDGTQLLDMTPKSGHGWTDADLKLGRSFYEPDLGLKIVPLGPAGTTPESVDILVKHVHYLMVEAESGTLTPPMTVVQDPLASNGQGIASAGGSQGTAIFSLDIPAAGEYEIWCRTRSTQPIPISLSLSVDGNLEGANLVLEQNKSSDWQWNRVAERSSGNSPGATPKDFSWTTGNHLIQFGGIGQNIQIDCILVTDDPTPNTPPLISRISNQVVTQGTPTVSIPFTITTINALSPGLTLTVNSSNPSLVPNPNIVFGGDTNSVNRTLIITPAPGLLGTSSITVNVIMRDGTSMSAKFSFTVIGVVQAMVNAAAPGDTLVIPAGAYIDRIIIDKDLSLQGAGAGKTAIDGKGGRIPLTVTNNATVFIRDLTLRNGAGGLRNYGTLTLFGCTISGNQTSLKAGGILNGSSGSLLLENCTVSSNRCFGGKGGGIYNEGDLTLINTTVSGNRATLKDDDSGGGGIYNLNRVTADHCTITQNRASRGGGIFNVGVAEMGNCIVAGNVADEQAGPDFFGELSSAGYNLIQSVDDCVITGHLIGNIISKDPRLGPLHDNGGATLTHALLANSPAIDAGSAGNLTMDQRGFARPLDVTAVANIADGADIGAFEFVPDMLREVRTLVGAGAAPGSVAVRIVLISQGDENAAEFRMAYPQAYLRNPRATLGLDAIDAAITFKSESEGQLHITLALPTGQVFSEGVRELLVVEFDPTSEAAGLALSEIKLDNSPGASTIRNAAGEKLSTGFPAQASWNNFRLAVRPEPNGDVTLILSGGAGFNWIIQATSDFSIWETVARLTNVSETAQFTESSTSGVDRRFYRAIAE